MAGLVRRVVIIVAVVVPVVSIEPLAELECDGFCRGHKVHVLGFEVAVDVDANEVFILLRWAEQN